MRIGASIKESLPHEALLRLVNLAFNHLGGCTVTEIEKKERRLVVEGAR